MSGSHECYLFCLTTTNIRKLLINRVQILPQIAQLISNFSLVRAFHTAILWLYEKPWFQVKRFYMAFYVLFIVLYKYALYIWWEVSCRLLIFFKMPYKALVFVKNKICKKILSIFVHVFILLYVKRRNRN